MVAFISLRRQKTELDGHFYFLSTNSKSSRYGIGILLQRFYKLTHKPMARLSPSLCINDVLPLHLLVEVLARLPLRHVFRCKSVCKLWLSCVQDSNSGIVGRFIQLNEEENNDLQQKQMVHVVTNRCEMLLVQPSCSISVTASQLSLDFLPFFDELVPPLDDGRRCKVVLASNNGLLLCSPNDSRYAEYYICNPLTRQWLALPIPPRSEECDIGVGFICDPFYNVDSFTVNDRFGVKLIRLLLTFPDWLYYTAYISAEVFSSQTGWSALELPDGLAGFFSFNCPPVPYKGKIHLLLHNCDVSIYDPETNELLEERVASGPPVEELYTPRGSVKFLVGFDRLSVCQGSFWIGHGLNTRLRVFVLVNGVWRLEHDVDTFDEMHWSSISVMQKVLNGALAIKFWSMHPSDPMIAYLSVDTSFLECNFRDNRIELLSEQQNNWSNVVTLSLPPWPTPLPVLSTTN